MSIPIVVSCLHDSDHTGISSGRIDYKISYLNDNIDKKTLDILPRRMKLVFDEKTAINNIEGFMGFYKLEAITNFHTRKCSTLLKVFEKNYLFKGKRDEMMCCFDSMDEMEITETQETKTIAGFVCKKSVIYLPTSRKSFDIYYTGEIQLKHPNATNPYRKIDGVLMEFELNLLHLKMRFTAEKFHPLAESADKKDFPKNTRPITRDQMTEILNRLMD
jgi:hypothetical protein